MRDQARVLRVFLRMTPWLLACQPIFPYAIKAMTKSIVTITR